MSDTLENVCQLDQNLHRNEDLLTDILTLSSQEKGHPVYIQSIKIRY